ncbi:MAG: hypothetical protein PVH61_12990 [Candidatus Aminicenantes bacterium]|jgi:hypothetical protein
MSNIQYFGESSMDGIGGTVETALLESGDIIEINPQDLNPTILQMGLLTGLIKEEHDGDYVFNTHWFKEPFTYLKDIPSNPELVKFLQTLMGGSAGSALGTPKTMDDKTWFPLQNPYPGEGQDPKPLGIYIVTTDPSNGKGSQIGLGLLHDFKPIEALTITPYGYFPLLQLPANPDEGFSFILGDKDHPVELGVNVIGEKGTFSTGSGKNSISFDGLKIGTAIYFVSGKLPSLDLVLLNLKLPGEAKASNRSLMDMVQHTSIEEWISMALSVFAAQLARAKVIGSKVEAMINSILEILGLVGDSPVVDWKALLENPGNAAKIFLDWFRTIANSQDILKNWLNDWYCLFNQLPPTPSPQYVTGKGTREDPLAITLLQLKITEKLTLNLDFTMASVVAANGDLSIYPGFTVATTPITPVEKINTLGIVLEAAAELVKLTIPSSGDSNKNSATNNPSLVLFPSFHVAVTAQNTEKGKPLISLGDTLEGKKIETADGKTPTFSIDTMALGFQYLYDETKQTATIPTPYFQLTNVNTAVGSWPVIDLTNFNVDTIEKLIGPIITGAIEKLLGDGEQNRYARSLSAVLGVTAPPSYPEEWPVKQMLLTGTELETLIKNPLGALGAYYTRCLTTRGINDEPVWKYLLNEWDIVLGGSGTTVAGSGTVADPWQIQLLAIGSSGAYLQAWQGEGSARQLNLGIYFGIPIPIASITANVGLAVHLLALHLPEADFTGDFSAHWMQAFSTQLKITGKDQGPITTPSLAGISLEIKDLLVEAGWSPAKNFFIDAIIEKVKLKSSFSTIDLGDLIFTSIGWSEQQLTQLAPAIVNALGLLLLQHGGRMGVTTTTLLGMLPNLPAIIDGKEHPDYPFALPTGLKLPEDWPVFDFKTPANPWIDVKTQLSNLIAGGGKFMEPAMQLLGWAITKQVPQAPSPIPTGKINDPWWVLLPNVWNLRFNAWVQSGNQWGLGVQRSMSINAVSDVQVQVTVRVDIPGFPLTLTSQQTEPAEDAAVLPRLLLTADISNPDKEKPLYVEPKTGLTIGYVEIGVYAQLEGGTIFFGPVLAFHNSKLKAGDKPTTVEITKLPHLPTFDSPQGIQVINALINAFMDKLSSLLSESTFKQLQALLGIMQQLEILQVTKTPEGKDVYGFNAGTWQAILANPGAYFAAKTKALLEDPEQFQEFFNHIAQLLGFKEFKLPAGLEGLQYLLAALGLLKSYNDKFAPVIDEWLHLVRNPLDFFATNVTGLFKDPEAIKQLVTRLAAVKTLPANPFRVDPTGTVITLTIPVHKAIPIGSEIKLYASLSINLKTFAFTAAVALGSQTLATAIAFNYTPTFKQQQLTHDYAFVLEGLPGSEPTPFAPLQLFPFPEDKKAYLEQLGTQIPLYILSSFSTTMLNRYVLPKHPTVLNIFKALGLVSSEGEEGQPPQIQPLLGILMHPVRWVLSEKVLGDGHGNISLDKLGNLLYHLTEAAGISNPDGISLKPYEHDNKKNGVALTGLPYGVTMILYSDSIDGVNLGATFAPPLPSPAPQVKLNAGLGFGLGNGLNISGGADLIFNLGRKDQETETQVILESRYEKGTFTLDISGKYREEPFPKTIQLVPFGGLNQFIPGSGDVKFLLGMIGDKLFAFYDEYKENHPGSGLVTFIDSIIELSGIEDGKSLYEFFGKITENPLAAFDESRAKDTIAAIYKLLNDLLKIQGFSIVNDGKRLRYQRSITALKGTVVQLEVGLNTIAGKTVFGLWLQPRVQVEWFILGLQNTGLGVALPINPHELDLVYSVELGLGTDLSQIPVSGLPSPFLSLGVNGDLSGINAPEMKLYPVQQSSEKGTLIIDILPAAKLVIQDEPTATPLDWLESFAVDFLVPLLANIALSIDPVKNWLSTTKIGQSTITPGQILTTWGLLNEKEGVYTLADLKKTFDIKNPIGIITKLIFAALDLLNGQTLIKISKGGKQIGEIKVVTESVTGGTLYGLSIRLQDIVVTSGSGGKSPKLVLQLGKWIANQEKGTNWIDNIDKDAGTALFFIEKDQKEKLSFYPKIELISVGIDFDGANEQKPLIDIKGFSVASIQPRVYLSLDFSAGTPVWDFGAALLTQGIGLPLGPGFGNQPGKKTNPVAQNLLSSGGNTGKTAAINPSFSASVSYVIKSKNFQFQLYDADGQPAKKVWIPIQRSFGPLQCRKIGIGWIGSSKHLLFLFDGNVALAGLVVDLEELEVGIPITTPTKFNDYTLDLAGLDISFNGGPVSISGGFLKDELPGGDIQYTGQAQIQANQFALGAFGSYAVVTDPQDNKKYTSLFIFAYLNAPLGGPPYFYLSGLCGGFGFNRRINIPRANDIEGFPFVAGIENPAVLGGSQEKPPTNMEVLKKLGTTIVPPERGTYWLAAGIQFGSFQLINAKAVIFLEFGKDFEVQLIGLGGIKLPKTGRTYVGAELAIKVGYKDSIGLFAAEAALTSNSYVLDPACKLTGGFAFYIWVKDNPGGASAGEFVLTLGGYSPFFKPLKYYPTEPRLGFSWHVLKSNVSIDGGAYFALTPSAVMAGGSLKALYHSGGLKAWFTAQADFLISWKPFHYHIFIGVSVGASYTVKVIWTTTFKVELGAEVEVWGPETAGRVTVKWWVISFTVYFGDQSIPKEGPKVIKWETFKGYFLPEDQAPAPPPQQLPQGDQSTSSTVKAAPPAALPKVQQVTHIHIANGLVKEYNDNGLTAWNVKADQLTLSVKTQVPLNQVTFDNSPGLAPLRNDTPFGIKPMGSVTFSYNTPNQMSSLSFAIKYYEDNYNLDDWDFTADSTGVPESLWGTVNTGKSSASAVIIKNIMVGIASAGPKPKPLPPGPPHFPITNFQYFPLTDRNLPLDSKPALKPTSPVHPDPDSLKIIEKTVMKPEVVTFREEILETVLGLGYNIKTDGRLDVMAAYAEVTFQSSPMLGELGSVGEVTTPSKGTIMKVPGEPVKTESTVPPDRPTIKAMMFQYTHPVRFSSVYYAAKASQKKKITPVKGTTFYTRGTFASPPVQQAIRTQVTTRRKKGGQEQQEITVSPGTTFLWDIPAGKRTSLKMTGPVPLRVVIFDRHNTLLLATVMEKGELPLPKNTNQLVITGLTRPDPSTPVTAGWHAAQSLVQVNPNALLAEGVVIIPQSPSRVPFKNRSEAYGTIQAQQMLHQCSVEVTENQIARGAVETIFLHPVKTVAVLVKPETANTGVPLINSVHLKAQLPGKKGLKYRRLKPKLTIVGDEESAVLFSLPGIKDREQVPLDVATAAGWIQTGIMGTTKKIDEVKANWEHMGLAPRVPGDLDVVTNTTTLQLTSQVIK